MSFILQDFELVSDILIFPAVGLFIDIVLRSIYIRGDQYWNKANHPPGVAAFSLKKYCNKKIQNRLLRLQINDLISDKSPQDRKKNWKKFVLESLNTSLNWIYFGLKIQKCFFEYLVC